MNTVTTKDGTEIYCKDWGKGQPNGARRWYSVGQAYSLKLIERTLQFRPPGCNTGQLLAE